ncbi:MAG: nucleotide modification associated domain-containing protein [Anaerorhabdus sp.]|uniref:nucleotide modification associated domain-containing protein n=1 Tax=Anaerorhabdus sp. TaxID=1872524 RepID=UPI002FC594A9
MNQEELHLKITQDLNKTYIEKNADYGDAFNKSLDNHGLTAAIVRMEDKMGRFSNLAGRPASMQVEESLEDTLLDLANYAIMTVMWLKQHDKPDTVDFYADGELYCSLKKDDKPRGGYHEHVKFVPDELIRTDFNKETNMYLVGLGKTTWGAHNLVDQSYIIQTLKEFKDGKLSDSIAWEHIQRFIVTK